MKRILSLVLALFMALGCASLVAVSAETLVETDFTLELESLEFTEEDNPADGDTITLEVYMQDLTDEDDLGSIQVNVNYDDTKLEFLAAREKTGTGKKAVTHMAGYFGLFQSAAPATNPARNFVVTTEMENPCWDSEWDINNDIFFVLDFKVLGDWAETEITLDGEAMPRRDASEGYYFTQDGVSRKLTWGSATITRPYEAEITPAENANFTKAYNYYRDFAPMAAEYFSETFWGGFEAFINKGLEFVAAGDQEALDAHSDAGVNGNWFINRMHFKSTAGINATTGGSAATVNGTDYVIPAATPILMNYDRLYVSHADYDGVDVAWSYSSTIITKPGVNVYDVMSFGGAVGGTGSTWRAYICEPTGIDGYYKLINLGGNTVATRPVIPEGGFAIVTHINGKNNSNCNTAAFEYNKYNSGLFWARQVHGVYAAGLSNGGYLKTVGITLNDGAAATLDTEGTWLTYKDPALNGQPGDRVYRDAVNTGLAADAEGRTNATRDAFVGFKSNAYIQGVSKLPEVPETVTVAVSGNGTVSGTIDGTAIADTASFSAVKSNTVVLTANGEGFKYWVGGNDAILSTDATITIPGGKALNLTAVFEDAAESETFNVYFKDSKTGKIVAVKEVAAGEVLTYDDVTAPSVKGYTFNGWKIYGALEAGYVVEGTTEVYATYTKDASTAKDLTVIDGANSKVFVRTFGAIATVGAKAEGFSYWTLDGVVVSTDNTFTFVMPSKACTLEAVYNQTAPAATAAVVDLCKDGQTFYFLMARSGEVKETGVLMTRKGTANDLVLNTTNKTVTKGVSSADADVDVVAFQKDATGKTGTWLVRGYVVLADNSVVYTDVASIVID